MTGGGPGTGRGRAGGRGQTLASIGAGAGLGALLALRSTVGWVVVAAGTLAPLSVWLVSAIPVAGWAALLVVATQLSGARFGFAGVHFLPEHLALVGLAASLAVRAPRSLLRRPAPYEALVLAWVVWNGATSLASAIRPAESLAIVGWLLLAWSVLWVVRSYLQAEPGRADRVLSRGATVAALIGAVSFALWVAALLGVAHIGVQPEYVTGRVAARGPSLEANLLGSTSLCWLFLLLRQRLVDGLSLQPWKVTGLVLGIVSTMTRAVWIATILLVVGSWLIDRTTRREGSRAGVGARRYTGQWVAMVAVVAALLTFAAPYATQKLASAFDFSSSTGAARLAGWKLAWGDVVESRSYLAGLGTNSYGQRHFSATLLDQPDYLGNLPLAVLYDTGLVGVVLLGGAMAIVVARGRTARARWLNALLVLLLVIVGTATNPIWFGFVWLTVAVADRQPAGRITGGPPPVPARPRATVVGLGPGARPA